jgi:hypothetical protein
VRPCHTSRLGSCKTKKERPPATAGRHKYNMLPAVIVQASHLPSPVVLVLLLLLLHDRLQWTLRNEKAGYYFLKEHGIKKSTQDKRTEKKRHTNLAIYRRAIDGMRFTVSPRLGSLRSCRGSKEVVEDGVDGGRSAKARKIYRM